MGGLTPFPLGICKRVLLLKEDVSVRYSQGSAAGLAGSPVQPLHDQTLAILLFNAFLIALWLSLWAWEGEGVSLSWNSQHYT